MYTRITIFLIAFTFLIGLRANSQQLLDTMFVSEIRDQSTLKEVKDAERLQLELVKALMKHQKSMGELYFDYDSIKKMFYLSRIELLPMYSFLLECNPWHYLFYRSVRSDDQSVDLVFFLKGGLAYRVSLTSPVMSVSEYDVHDSPFPALNYYHDTYAQLYGKFSGNEIFVFGNLFCKLDPIDNKILCLDKELDFIDLRSLLESDEIFDINIPECY